MTLLRIIDQNGWANMLDRIAGIGPEISSQNLTIVMDLSATNPMAHYGAIIVCDDKEILLKSVNSTHNNPMLHSELSVIHTLFNNGF